MTTTTTTTTNFAVERDLNGSKVRLGTVRRTEAGYRFYPNTSARKPSRVDHPTMEACLPTWVGYPNRCETRAL